MKYGCIDFLKVVRLFPIRPFRVGIGPRANFLAHAARSALRAPRSTFNLARFCSNQS